MSTSKLQTWKTSSYNVLRFVENVTDLNGGMYKSDYFTDSSINANLWTQILGNGTFTETDGKLLISVANGVNALWPNTGTINAPRIYTSLPTGDFTCYIKIESDTIIYQSTRGIYFGNGADVIRFERTYSSSTNGFNVSTLISGTAANVASVASTTLPAWFKVTRVGSTYTFSYSTDGSSYTQLYTTSSLGFTPTVVGMFGLNWGAYPAISSRVDDFKLYYTGDLVDDAYEACDKHLCKSSIMYNWRKQKGI